MRALVAGSFIVFVSSGAFGQSAAFEVASVKPNPSGDYHSSSSTSPGGLTMRNVPLKQIIEMAYDVRDYTLSGPDWLGSERFDVVAKPPAGAHAPDFGPMLQSLLAERFKLAVHRERKILPAYSLVAASSGPRL